MKRMLTFAAAFAGLALAVPAQEGPAPGYPDDLHHNKVIDKLEKGMLVTGLYVSSMDPSNALGLINANGMFAGDRMYEKPALDFVLVEMEHEPYDFEKLRTFLLTLNSKQVAMRKGNVQADLVTIVNLPDMESMTPIVPTLLDLGIHGVKLPGCDTAEEARELVAACRFPRPRGSEIAEPEGTRHAYPLWASHIWGISMEQYEDRADVWPLNPDGELLVWVHIESAEGVENIEEILDVPGISGVTFGPHDFSFSAGLRGRGADPQERQRAVDAAYDKIKAAADARNIPIISWALTGEQIQEKIDAGDQVLIIGADTDNHLYQNPEYGWRGPGPVLEYLRGLDPDQLIVGEPMRN